MLSVLLLAYLLMLLSGFIDSSGESVISRLMSHILSSVVTTNILNGFCEYYSFLQP
ncbi:hypothetical protein C427_4014 [Paraglaciecola psychrophila 170]|uniref:Uncharacterized protein n=1 Tax=Paraglaciecola psychrophila 170 TaxID=1129794 RepID=M4RV61_9ALTE|nr:hypothetical protein C427_4014 [Paraglaciecola psychrophila 170]